MSKVLKYKDVKKLKRALSILSSMEESLRVLSDDAPIYVSFSDVSGSCKGFHVDDMGVKAGIAAVVAGLMKKQKDVIRKKYDIDIK